MPSPSENEPCSSQREPERRGASPCAITLSPTDPVRNAVEAMALERVGVVCVCDRLGRPIGVVTDRDVVTRGCYERLPLDREPIGSVMTRNPLICGPYDDVDEVELQMERRGVGRVLGADEGQLVGLMRARRPQSHTPLNCSRTARPLHCPPHTGPAAVKLSVVMARAAAVRKRLCSNCF